MILLRTREIKMIMLKNAFMQNAEKSSHVQIYGDPFVRDLGNGYTQPANCLINSTSIKSM